MAGTQDEICSGGDINCSMTEEPPIVTGTADWRNLSVLDNGSLIFDCDDFNGNIPFTSTMAQVILYILYGTMFVIALGGNSLVCAAVIRTRNNLRPNNLTNYFIVNLAIGDILIIIFCVPTSVLSTLVFHYWLLPSQLCSIFNFFQAVAVLVSAYTLVVISMERYLAIMYLFRPRRGTKYAKISILIVWLLAMAISLPILVVSDVEQPDIRYEMCDFYTCTEKWSDKKQKYSYTIALLILQYLVPLLILLFSYISIAIVVWGKQAPGEAEDNRDQRMIRSKTKTIKMLMAVVIVYTICWLPFNVLNLVMDINEDINRWYGLPYIWAMLHWLAMSHACYNPFIYCWMSTPFRQGIFNMLKCVPIIRRFVPDRSHALNTSAVGIPLTGMGQSARADEDNQSFITSAGAVTWAPTSVASSANRGVSSCTAPSAAPSAAPSLAPSAAPSLAPSAAPSDAPSVSPSLAPSAALSVSPSVTPCADPSTAPSVASSTARSVSPSVSPCAAPSAAPSIASSAARSVSPSVSPSIAPSAAPSAAPSVSPCVSPSAAPSAAASAATSAASSSRNEAS